MIYAFRDINEEVSLIPLPSEAMQINGVYIENEIEGYRTLYVKGRESLSPEFETAEINTKDGSMRKSRKYPARIITVGYQLRADSTEAFRKAYNKLGGILNANDAELIFNDEPDKFFIGTPSLVGEVSPGSNTVTGEIEITCFDPLKYSVLEHEATADESGNIFIDYNGTYKAYPVLEADFYKENEGSGTTLSGNGDCGYVAFFNEDEKVIQCGDPAEEDGTNVYEKSQTLINQTFEDSSGWGSTAKSLWSENGGVLLPAGTAKNGTIGMKVASYAVPANPATTSAVVLSARSDIGSPYVNYSVRLTASGRNTNSVIITMTVTAALWGSASWLYGGYPLTGSLYIGGQWHSIAIKASSAKWRGTTAHTVSTSFTVAGLTASQASLGNIKFKVSGNGSGTLSERGCSSLTIATYEESIPETYYLGAISYGSGTEYHAATISKAIPADSAGVSGASDFTVTYNQKMSIGKAQADTQQIGAFQLQLTDSSGASVAGVRIVKNKAGKFASLVFYVGGKAVQTIDDIDLSYGNTAIAVSSIIKSGEKVTFDIAGRKAVFADTSIKQTKATRITIGFEQFSSVNALSYNGLYWVKLVKNNCDTWQDIPNKFSANDVLEADCKAGEIYLNGVCSPQLGALGNDWETFYLAPGINQIGVAYSSWVTSEYAPDVKVRYREAFL